MRVGTPLRQHGQALVRFLTERSAGFATQALTLFAAFAPILLGLADHLVTVVQVSALAALLFQASTLSAGIRIPREAADNDARKTSAVGLAALATASLGILASAVVLDQLGHSYLQLLLLPPLLFGQGLFYVSMGWAIRQGNHSAVMKGRLTYGVCTALLTIVACLGAAGRSDPTITTTLIVAPALSYLIASLFVLRPLLPRTGKDPLVEILRPYPRTVLAELAASTPLNLSSLIGTFVAQAPALFIHSLGSYAPAWVVINRIASGLQTAGSQVMGPSIEIELVRSLTARHISATTAIRRGILSGLALAAIFLTSLGALYLTTEAGIDWRGADGFYLAIAVIGLAAQVVLAPWGRAGALLGLDGFQFAWESSRAVACLVVVVTLSGPLLFAGIGTIYILGGLGYVARIRRAAAEQPSVGTEAGSRIPAPAGLS